MLFLKNFQVLLFFFLTLLFKMCKRHLVLIDGRLAEWLMQRTANPFILVRFRYRPPKKDLFTKKSKKVKKSVAILFFLM